MSTRDELRKIAMAKIEKQAEKIVQKLVRRVEKAARKGKLSVSYFTPDSTELDGMVVLALENKGFTVSLERRCQRYISW